jgi:hypothetical protein
MSHGRRGFATARRQQLKQQEQSLDTLNQQLLDKAAQAAQRFGDRNSLVEPGGVVKIEQTPK